MRRSLSDHEAVVALGLAVLVSNEAISAFGDSFALDFKEGLKVAEQVHLVAVVLRVVLNVALVSTQVTNNHLLLGQL